MQPFESFLDFQNPVFVVSFSVIVAIVLVYIQPSGVKENSEGEIVSGAQGSWKFIYPAVTGFLVSLPYILQHSTESFLNGPPDF